MHYVLNESGDRAIAGLVEVFPSLQTLLQRIDPIDVRQHEYFAYDEDGYLLDIGVDDDTGRVCYRGHTQICDRSALDGLLFGLIEDLRRDHPGCVDRPQDMLGSLSGRDLTVYVLQLYENIELEWRSNRLIFKIFTGLSDRLRR